METEKLSAAAPRGRLPGVPRESERPATLRESGVEPPPGTTLVSLLGVDYYHLKTKERGDLFLTRFGRPFWRNLLPENWYAKEWFEAKRRRLVGSSLVYHVPTKKVGPLSLELVVKWNRVGEEVPFDTQGVTKFIHAEFNSPFEEFALLMELRSGAYGPPGIWIRTQKPLAIFVLPDRLQLWQTGRSEAKIAAKISVTAPYSARIEYYRTRTSTG